MTAPAPTSETPKPSTINRYFEALLDLERFVQVCLSGFSYASVASEVIDVVHRLKDKSTPPPAERLREAVKLETFSKAQTEQGFPFLFAVATVQTWSILEALADDVLEDELSLPAVRAACEPLKKMKGNLLEFSEASEEERVRILAERLKETVSAALKPGIGRFEEVLCLVGLGGRVSENVRRTMLEISEVRHVIVHRANDADDKFRTRCPWFEVGPQNRVQVSQRHFALYGLCARWYLLELDRRRSEKRGEELLERHGQVQDVHVKGIEASWASRAGGAWLTPLTSTAL